MINATSFALKTKKEKVGSPCEMEKKFKRGKNNGLTGDFFWD